MTYIGQALAYEILSSNVVSTYNSGQAIYVSDKQSAMSGLWTQWSHYPCAIWVMTRMHLTLLPRNTVRHLRGSQEECWSMIRFALQTYEEEGSLSSMCTGCTVVWDNVYVCWTSLDHPTGVGSKWWLLGPVWCRVIIQAFKSLSFAKGWSSSGPSIFMFP